MVMVSGVEGSSSGSHVTLQPVTRITFENVATSLSTGMLWIVLTPSASTAAAMSGSAVFFEPPTWMEPRRGRPPWMTSLSMSVVGWGSRQRGRKEKRSQRENLPGGPPRWRSARGRW